MSNTTEERAHNFNSRIDALYCSSQLGSAEQHINLPWRCTEHAEHHKPNVQFQESVLRQDQQIQCFTRVSWFCFAETCFSTVPVHRSRCTLHEAEMRAFQVPGKTCRQRQPDRALHVAPKVPTMSPTSRQPSIPGRC